MVLLGLGGNLPLPGCRSPVDNLEMAIAALTLAQVTIGSRSSWYRTAPVAADPQPWYANGVVELHTTLPPHALMALLLATEQRFGRTRSVRNAPRTVDLDLLAYHEVTTRGGEPPLELPHPRMHERAFVLVPLVEIAPDWRHPIVHRTARELLDQLPPGQQVERIADRTVAG